VSFIIPVRDDAEGLRRCLEAIGRDAPGAEVIVADNGSRDASRDVAASFGAVVLDLPGLRVAALRNRAAAHATGDLLALVDADVVIPPGWVARASAHFASPDVAAAGAEYCSPPGANWVQRVYDGLRHHDDGCQDVRWLPAGSMMVRRAAFERIAGFRETLVTCEDVDLCTRLRQSGLRVVGDSTLRCAHYGDPSSLAGLFTGELWRGRDNLRVGLGTVESWHDLPSLVIPVLWLLTAVAGVMAAGAASVFGPEPMRWWAAAPLVLLALTLIRGLRIYRRARRHGVSLAAACLVALVYDTARALAPVVPIDHRRAVPGARAVAQAERCVPVKARF
jgi:GT2 family glycosyltransferase